MKYAPYIKQEKYIAASDAGSIIERWRYGYTLLDDTNATTPQGNLRHGVLAGLIGRAAQRGYKISEREIRRRLECARAYKTEAEIGRAAADFEYWWHLVFDRADVKRLAAEKTSA